jgi:hypothetical protein
MAEAATRFRYRRAGRACSAPTKEHMSLEERHRCDSIPGVSAADAVRAHVLAGPNAGAT